jgi:predicted metalloprotease with PDZ domain
MRKSWIDYLNPENHIFSNSLIAFQLPIPSKVTPTKEHLIDLGKTLFICYSFEFISTMKSSGNKINRVLKSCLWIALTFIASSIEGNENDINPSLRYSVSMPEPENHLFHVMLFCKGYKEDTIDFKMPQWMPGYYQIMEYSDRVRNFSAISIDGKVVSFIKSDKNTWRVIPGVNTSFNISYDIYSDKNFVASNYLDTTHGYIVPAATFMYIHGHLSTPISLKIIPFSSWKDIATGLGRAEGMTNEFTASDFDMLYDCPILIGNLEELPSFDINGVVHHFLAYNPGNFNRDEFISSLEKTVRAGIEIIGDIPYKEYTFIGIGPGRGGIEHLNNTTVSFSGSGLEEPGAMVRTLKFLGHEYFHHYNVKRIRPYELGPFDYERENRTNLLWVSEGLTVYYEYLMVRRAGLMSEEDLLTSIGENITAIENDAGRQYQSLSQASYNTWEDGPFGDRSGGPDRSISYYEKGPIVGMILDFSIRNATQNNKSLDDVMRFLYRHYYKELHRGFTDAEFQQACEDIGDTSLSREFEYVFTTKEIDYTIYLAYAGLKLAEETDSSTGKSKFTISRQDNMTPYQMALFGSWNGN